MHREPGGPPPGRLGAWLTVCVYPLCRRLRDSSAARGASEMGNSVRSAPAPPERTLPCPDGESGFSGAMSHPARHSLGAEMG